MTANPIYQLTIRNVAEEIWNRTITIRELQQQELARQLWEERKQFILRGEEIPRQTHAEKGR